MNKTAEKKENVKPTKKITEKKSVKAKETSKSTSKEKVDKKKVAEKKVAEPKTKKATTTTKKVNAKTSIKKEASTKEKTATKRVKKNILKKDDFYQEIIKRKWKAHDVSWLYIEINANDLSKQMKGNNPLECSWAMLDALLEGDIILDVPENDNLELGTLTCRYYCDNLSPERKKYEF